MKSSILAAAIAAVTSTIAISGALPASAGVLLGTGTLNMADDLTRIDASGTVLEFLDLSVTAGSAVADALSSFGGDGFSWATGSQVAELFGAFGITYSIAPVALADLGATDAQALSFTTHLGTTLGDAAMGWIDDLTSATYHTYACISVVTCGPGSFTYNSTTFAWPAHRNIGVYLVREAAIPEPATLALFGLGLAGLGFARRKRAA